MKTEKSEAASNKVTKTKKIPKNEYLQDMSDKEIEQFLASFESPNLSIRKAKKETSKK